MDHGFAFVFKVHMIYARQNLLFSSLCLFILLFRAAYSPPVGFNDPKSWAVDLVNPCVSSSSTPIAPHNAPSNVDSLVMAEIRPTALAEWFRLPLHLLP
jgi:hypothetical protein